MRHFKIFLIVYFNLETFKFKKFKKLKKYNQTKKFLQADKLFQEILKLYNNSKLILIKKFEN